MQVQQADHQYQDGDGVYFTWILIYVTPVNYNLTGVFYVK